MSTVHVRQRGERRRLGVDAAGQIRPQRVDPESDPRGRTLCGAMPTDRDLNWRSGHAKSGRPWITCADCLAHVEKDTAA